MKVRKKAKNYIQIAIFYIDGLQRDSITLDKIPYVGEYSKFITEYVYSNRI